MNTSNRLVYYKTNANRLYDPNGQALLYCQHLFHTNVILLHWGNSNMLDSRAPKTEYPSLMLQSFKIKYFLALIFIKDQSQTVL